jgi:hypothetical protein
MSAILAMTEQEITERRQRAMRDVKMTTIIDKLFIERRQRVMRDVGEVCIFLDGINATGEAVHTDYILSEAPGQPNETFIELSYRWFGADDVRYHLLNIVLHVGSEWGMLVDGLKLDDLGKDGIRALLSEIGSMLIQAEEDGVKIHDAVAAWEKDRTAPAV